MPIICNAKGVQFWKEVNAKLEELGKSVEDIHEVCPELAVITLRKWQSKGALPASEHICLIKTCLDQWAETKPEPVNEISAGENPMVVDTNEVEKLKAKITAQEKRMWTLAARIKTANKKLRACGQQEVKADDFEAPSDNERVAELEELLQSRDIELTDLGKLAKETAEREAHYKAECDRLSNLVDEKDRAINEALADMERLNGTLFEVKGSLLAAEECIDTKKELITALNEDVEKLKANFKDYVDKLEERNRVINVYQREKELLQNKIEELQRTCADERQCVNELLVKPSYYIKGGIECKDLIAIMLEEVYRRENGRKMDAYKLDEFEFFCLTNGIKEITCLEGDEVPTYMLTMMGFLKAFPDTKLWKVDAQYTFYAYLIVEFNERKFMCKLNESQQKYVSERYGFEIEDKKNETV